MKKLILLGLTFIAIALTACAANNTAETLKSETYESKDGWKVTYHPEVFAMSEGENGEVNFSYQGDAAGSNVVSVSYHKDRMPNEVLYDATADVDDSKVTRNEGWFGSTYPAWTYSRYIQADASGSGLGVDYTAIEHNGGTLLISILHHKDTDDERNMDTSDAIEGLVNSIELVNHKHQQEMAYKVGTYVNEYQEEIEGENIKVTDTITLNEDHTGVMSFQDDIDIIWSSTELIERDGDNRYEYTVEGDTLLVNMFEGEDWVQFQRKK